MLKQESSQKPPVERWLKEVCGQAHGCAEVSLALAQGVHQTILQYLLYTFVDA